MDKIELKHKLHSYRDLLAEYEQIKDELAKDMCSINEEQALLTYGILACLKGLQEKGCNGPVTEAINKIETYLNEKAHEN